MLDALLHDTKLQAIAIAIAAIVLERLLRVPPGYHPITLMRGFAEAVATAGLRGKRQTEPQLRLSGALALVTLSLPLILIVATLLLFAEFTVFFDGVFLLVALQFTPTLVGSKAIQAALTGRKKALARNLLARWTLRETHSLSHLGICKATIESLLLRYCYQYLCVLFWYFIAGGAGAIMYRLAYEAAQSWNVKLTAFRHYGMAASRLCFLLQWLPVRITAVLFGLTVNINRAFSALQQHRQQRSSHTLLLTCCGGALDVELGGPAYYNGHKTRLPTCGGTRAPELIDIGRARVAIYQQQGLLIAILLLVAAAVYGSA